METLITFLTAFPEIFHFVMAFMDAMTKPLHITHQQQERPSSEAVPVASERSKAIDQLFQEDAESRKHRYTVLPLGAFSMEEILQQLMDGSEVSLAKGDLALYRDDVHQYIITCTKALVDSIQAADVHLSSDANHCFNYLCNHVANPGATMTEETGKAIDTIWRDSSINKGSYLEYELVSSAPYFFDGINKIATPNYSPTDADIIRSRRRNRGVFEYRFGVDGSTINVIDVGQQSSQRGKWIHQFSKVTAILFVVDISCYNNWISEHNEMMDRIVLFDSVINSRWFPENTIVLFLSNISEFRRKLARSPLKDHFRDFDGGNDPDQAAEYLLGRFKQVDRSQRNRLYTHLVDPYDASNIRLVAAAINEDLRRKSQAL